MADISDDRPQGLRLTLVTVALILAPLLQVLDSSILSIALKQMQGSLSASQDQMAWVLTSYLIAVAVMTPFWGALSGIFGRKPLLLFTIAGFMVFSLLSGTSESLTEILIYRFLQGMLGAALIPLSQSSLLSTYRREDFSIAMSWWGVGIMFGPIIGPTLGGYITEYFSWRWAFYLNIPVGVVAFIMIALLVPRPGIRERRKFNYFGYSMLAIGVAALQFVLDRGTRLDWYDSTTIIVLTGISTAALWVFAVNSATSKTPFVDPVLFRDRNYVFGMALRVLFGAMLFGSLILVPPFVQNVGGYPLVESGLVMAPRGFGAMVGAFVVGRLIRRIDPRKVIVFGMLVSAATMWEFSNFTEDMVVSHIVAVSLLQGVGFASLIVPVNTVAFSTMAAAQRDVGTAFYSLLNNLGRSLGIALLSSYWVNASQANHARLSEFVNPFSPLFGHMPVPPVWDPTDPSGLAALNKVVVGQADLLAYISDFRLLAAVIVICIPFAFMMRNPNSLRRQVTA